MPNQFLPSFELAPPHNRLLVTQPRRDGQVQFYGGAPTPEQTRHAQTVLGVRQRVSSFLGDAVIDGSYEAEHVTAWSTLKAQTNQWLTSHIMSLPIDDHESICVVATPDEAKAEILSAGREGVETILAFLEALPSIKFPMNLTKPNQEIADVARASKGFIIAWSNLSGTNDRALAFALANPKPRTMGKVFHDLHFDPSWFCYKNGRVGLDPAKVRLLRSYHGARPNVDSRIGPRALFGCPASKMIPRLYDMVVAEAEKAELFEQKYESGLV